jgi:prevent-host-death family protein
MRSYSIRDAKNRLSALLARVRRGARIVITHRGVPVAMLVPPEAGGGRLEALVRAGLVARRRRPPSRAVLEGLPVTPSKPLSAVEVLLGERAEGR